MSAPLPLPPIWSGEFGLYGTGLQGDQVDADLSACVSPEALMAYCESRMNGIDTQIKATFDQQQKTNQEQQVLSQALQSLQSFGDGTLDPNSLSNGKNTQQCKDMEAALEQAIKQIRSIDPGSPAIAQLESLHDRLMGTGSGPYVDGNGQAHGYYNPDYKNNPPDGGHTEEDGTIGADEMKGFVDDLNNINSGLSSNSELQMINLQSLMSQRQTAVELTTNLIQTLDDTMGKIVTNVGH